MKVQINIFIATLLLLVPINISAQAQEKMLVYMKDGSVVEYLMSEVDHVELQATEDNSGTPAEGVGGTIAEVVDLALPSGTLWAKHNVGGSYTEDYGLMMDHGSSVGAWGTEWNLPTKEQWQELYDNCTWQWTMQDGVEGRLLKSNANGNELFLPAAGVSLDGDILIRNSVGLYWTASKENSDATVMLGIYFDSANIYRMEYPVANGLSVRLVK